VERCVSRGLDVLQHRPVGDRQLGHVGILGGRDVRDIGRRHHALAPGPQQLDQAGAAVGVELAPNVVSEHERQRPARVADRLALGQQQREQRQALLALRAVGAQLAAVARKHELVAVRTVTGEAAVEV
jgi:hypothetical protein